MIIRYQFQIDEKIEKSNTMILEYKDLNKRYLTAEDLINIFSKDFFEIKEPYHLYFYNYECEGFESLNNQIDLNNFDCVNKSLNIIVKILNNIRAETEKIIDFEQINEIRQKSEYNINYELKKETLIQEFQLMKNKNCSNLEKFNIAFLYSNPIKDDKNESNYTLETLFDFETEMRKLFDFFKSQKKKILLKFEIFTFETLENVIKAQPDILFISSYGSFNQKGSIESIFYEQEIGLQKKLMVSSLELMSKLETNFIPLVIISSFMSKSISKFFPKENFPNILGIQSKTQLIDKAGMNFLFELFKNLLNGFNLKQSYSSSMASIKLEKNEYVPCCCVHEHKEKCKFIEDQNRELKYCENLDHIRTCKCKDEFYNIHTYCNTSKLINKEKYEFNENKICCCVPSHTHHSKEDKFFKRFNKDELVLFKFAENGEPCIVNKNHCLNLPFTMNLKNNVMFGRNDQISKTLDVLCDESIRRPINIIGEEGVGKKSYVKMCARYLFERKIFDHIIYIECKMDFSGKAFMSEMKTQLGREFQFNFQKKNLHEIFDFLTQKLILFVIVLGHNFDPENQEIFDFLNDMIKATSLTKVIISSRTNISPVIQSTVLGKTNNFIASKILNYVSICKNRRVEIELSKIQSHWSFLTLHKIISLSFLKNNKDLKKHIKSDNLHEINKSLKDMLNEKPLIFVILHVVSFFPYGIFLDDLNFIFHEHKSELLNCVMDLVDKSMVVRESDKYYQKDIVINNENSQSFTCLLKSWKKENRDESSNYYFKVLDFLRNFSFKVLKDIHKSPKDTSLLNSMIFGNSGFWISLKSREVEKHELSKIRNPHAKHSLSLNSSNFGNESLEINKESVSFYEIPKFGSFNRNSSDSIPEIRHYSNESSKSKAYNQRRLIYRNIEERETEDSSHFKKYNLKDYELTLKNFFYVLRIEELETILPNLQSVKKVKFQEILEELSIWIPSHFLNYERIEESINSILTFINVLEKFEYNHALGRLLTFFILNIATFNESKVVFEIRLKKRNTPVDLVINFPIKNESDDEFMRNIDLIYSYVLEKFHDLEEAQGELKLCKAIIEFRINKKLNEDLFADCKRIYKNLKDLFNLRKIHIIFSKINLEIGNFTEEVLDDISSSLTYFKNEKNIFLEVKCLICLSEWYLGINNLFKAKEIANEAFSLSQNSQYEQTTVLVKEIEKVISKINKKIQKNSENLFIFLRSENLLQSFNRIVYPNIIYTSHFKKNIIQNLRNTRKNLQVIFDILNEETLENAFRTGAKILYLSADLFQDSESLFLEGGDIFIEKTGDDIRKYFAKYGTKFDLVLISTPESRKLANVFIECGSRHVIVPDYENDFLDLILQYPLFPYPKLVEKFLNEFLTQLLKDNSIISSFESSYRVFNNELKQHLDVYFKFRIPINFENFVKLNLLPINHPIHEKRLYDEYNTIGGESFLKIGKIHDLVKRRIGTINTFKLDYPLIGMKRELFDCIHILLKNENLYLFGRTLTGKTTLINYVASYIFMRNYFQNGIIAFDLTNINSIAQFRLNLDHSNFWDKLKTKSSAESKILIILDHVDEIISNDEINFFNFIESQLKLVVFVLVSRSDFPMITENFKKYELTPIEESLSPLVFIQDLKRDLTEKDFSVKSSNFYENLLMSKNIQRCEGYPGELKKLAIISNTKPLVSIQLKEFSNREVVKKFKKSLKNQSFGGSTFRQREISYNVNRKNNHLNLAYDDFTIYDQKDLRNEDFTKKKNSNKVKKDKTIKLKIMRSEDETKNKTVSALKLSSFNRNKLSRKSWIDNENEEMNRSSKKNSEVEYFNYRVEENNVKETSVFGKAKKSKKL